MSSSLREAAALFSTAEGYLRNEQVEDCLRVAAAALEVFKSLGDSGQAGFTDTLCMMADAHAQIATAQQRKPEEALAMVTQALSEFRASRDRRGEASMLLSLAVINHDKRGRKKRGEALESAAEALRIFREVEDKKSEALTLLLIATAHFKCFMYDDMLKESQAALDILDNFGDKFLKAKAMGLVGLSLASMRRTEAALEHGRAAVALWQELGLERQAAMQLHTMASWLAAMRLPKKALLVSEQALQIFRSVGPAGLPGAEPYRREALSVALACELLIQTKQPKTALKFAKAALERFQQLGSKAAQAHVQDSMGRIFIALDKPEKAIAVVDEARAIAESLGDMRWSARLMHGVAQAHIKSKDTNEAIYALDRAVALAQAAGDSQETARLQQVLCDALLFKRRDLKGALSTATEAQQSAQKTGDKRAEGHAVLRLALLSSSMGDGERGLVLAKEAQDCFQEAFWPRGEAQVLHLVAEMRAHMGELEAALEAAEERLTVMRELNDLTLEAQALLQVASLHHRDRNFAEAEKLAKEVQQLGSKDRNLQIQIQALMLLGQIYGAQVSSFEPGDKEAKPWVDKALRAASDAVQLAGKAQDRGLRAQTLYRRAESMVLGFRFHHALKDVKEAGGIFEALDASVSLGRCLLVGANIKQATGERDSAMADLDRATGIAQATRDASLTQECEVLRKALDNKLKEEEARRQQGMQQPQAASTEAYRADPTSPTATAPEVSAVPALPESKGLDPAYVAEKLMFFIKEAIASDDEVELDSAFMEAGMDSLSSVALMSMVAKEFRMSLSPSLVFDFPTPRTLQDHLIEESRS